MGLSVPGLLHDLLFRPASSGTENRNVAYAEAAAVTQACSFGGHSVIGIRPSRGAEKRKRATVSGSDD